jgi:hypothetical protein
MCNEPPNKIEVADGSPLGQSVVVSKLAVNDLQRPIFIANCATNESVIVLHFDSRQRAIAGQIEGTPKLAVLL